MRHFSLSGANLFITVGEAGTKGVRCQMLSRDPSRQSSAISPALPILLASFANDAKPFITVVEAGSPSDRNYRNFLKLAHF